MKLNSKRWKLSLKLKEVLKTRCWKIKWLLMLVMTKKSNNWRKRKLKCKRILIRKRQKRLLQKVLDKRCSKLNTQELKKSLMRCYHLLTKLTWLGKN